jgi:hypothetical protein
VCKKEDVEWKLAFSSVVCDCNGDDSDYDYDGTSLSLALPSTSPTTSKDNYTSFGDFISLSPPAPWEALPKTTP